MRSWRKSWKRGDSERQVGTTSSLTAPPLELQTTSLDNRSDGDVDSMGQSSGAPHKDSGEVGEGETLRNKLTSLLPQKWGSVVQKWGRGGASPDQPSSRGGVHILPNGTRVSPPVSPLPKHRAWGRDTEDDDTLASLGKPFFQESELSSVHPAEYYAEKLEVYHMKYSYLKSWPGLLRLLAGLELLFGGMVFACVCAYIQKDSQWSNSYGLYNGMFNNGQGLSGYSYNGPMTPFVLAVVGLCWVVSLILLLMGLTMYYRSILLDAPWWPLTEGAVNVALFLLYMAAGIVFLNDLNRGGLCAMTVGVNPVMAGLCRVDGGQMAGAAFIFITMAMYLVSFLVCLKMWRHEATRRERRLWENEEQHHHGPALPKPRRFALESEHVTERQGRTSHVADEPGGNAGQQKPASSPSAASPAAYAAKPHVVADYVPKYPEILCAEDRERYKAVFNDQYQEYKDLHADVSSTLDKFRQMDIMMDRLLRGDSSQGEKKRIEQILKTYEQKKSDPAFQEKKQRCDYLKGKLSHIKNRIRDFDLGGRA